MQRVCRQRDRPEDGSDAPPVLGCCTMVAAMAALRQGPHWRCPSHSIYLALVCLRHPTNTSNLGWLEWEWLAGCGSCSIDRGRECPRGSAVPRLTAGQFHS